jgi:peptidyl-prolyl cis-trans isomerase B (cyclophilin B)
MPRLHPALVLLPVVLTGCGPGASPAPAGPPPFAQRPGEPAIEALVRFAAERKIDKTQDGWRTRLPQPPKVAFEPGKQWLWVLATSKGTVRIRFDPGTAPIHVGSTIYLTQLGFYDGLRFHRVIPAFMLQGGCPLGTGGGSPGYQYDGEIDPKIKHDRPGLLSMANTGQPRTDGSQFFITVKETPHLDGKHTIFGEVVSGMEVVRRIEVLGSDGGATVEPILIERATIEVK